MICFVAIYRKIEPIGKKQKRKIKMLGLFKKNKNQETENRQKLNLAQFGKEESWEWQGHRIVYTILGEGAPLLMLHGISAASWAYEFRYNFAAMAQQYRVYAPDLPGFGRSERKPIEYTAEMYIQFIADFARYIIEREGQAPATYASSLTSAHLIGAVARGPENFGPLVLACPTGLEKLNFVAGKTPRRIRRVLLGPVGNLAFWLLTSRRSTRTFLKRDGYYDSAFVNEELIDAYQLTARQPNAKYAPISFITFNLNHSVAEEWPKIEQPVLIIWGREAMITPLTTAARFVELRPATELEIIERARVSVCDERADEFNSFALGWLTHQNWPGIQSNVPATSAA